MTVTLTHSAPPVTENEISRDGGGGGGGTKGASMYEVRAEGGREGDAANLRTNNIDFADRKGEGVQQIRKVCGRHICKTPNGRYLFCKCQAALSRSGGPSVRRSCRRLLLLVFARGPLSRRERTPLLNLLLNWTNLSILSRLFRWNALTDRTLFRLEEHNIPWHI